MLARRLQIRLDESRYKLIVAEAGRREVAVAVIVREAIDLAYPSTTGRRTSVANRILAAPTMTVPQPDDLRAELDDIRAGKL